MLPQQIPGPDRPYQGNEGKQPGLASAPRQPDALSPFTPYGNPAKVTSLPGPHQSYGPSQRMKTAFSSLSLLLGYVLPHA